MKQTIFLFIMASMLLSACRTKQEQEASSTPSIEDFNYIVDKFADIEILRYRVPGFEDLSLKEKELIYYLSEAALLGRDILYDQNNKHNLTVRRTLEAIYVNYRGDRHSEEFANLTIYLKQVCATPPTALSRSSS